jgi:hypothetical protein
MRTTLFWRVSAEVALLVFLIVLFLVALVGTRGLSPDGRLFPLVVTLSGLPVIVAALVQTLLRARRGIWEPATSREPPMMADESESPTAELEAGAPTGDGNEASDVVKSVRFWLWFLGFCVAMWGFGFYVGVPVISGVYVLVDGKKSLLKSALTGFLVWAFMYGVFTRGFGIIWPSGYFF